LRLYQWIIIGGDHTKVRDRYIILSLTSHDENRVKSSQIY